NLGVAQEARVPVEGEALPGRGEPRPVEGEDREHEERRVQEEVDQEGEEAERSCGAAHPRSWAARRGRRKRKRRRITTAESRKESAAPKGMSRAIANCDWMRLPTYVVRAPPRRSGARKLPREGMKTRTEPATIPDAVRGRVTARSVRKGEAPRSAEASSSER